jgi:hypothetical protein
LSAEPILTFESETVVVEEYRPLAVVGFRVGPIPTGSPIRVRFDVVGGTAAEGEDYWIDVKTVDVNPEFSSLGWGYLRFRLQDVDAAEPEETILLEAGYLSTQGKQRATALAQGRCESRNLRG